MDAQSFALRYERRLPELRQLAGLAENAIREVLEPLHLELHHISARAKELTSAIGKVRGKKYGRPWQQLTDQVGARVIVYYPEDVDRAANAMRAAFEVDERRSVDKRRTLQIRQFGYRSLHLLIRLGKQFSSKVPSSLCRLWIEVQVRSLLEHAWAEIEHEICYKSGSKFPDALLRQFGALAGALEILDLQFSALRGEREKLITELREKYENNRDLDEPLDAARLVALLEAKRPEAPGWRVKEIVGRRFARNSDAACVEALASAGILTARSLLKVMASAKCRRKVDMFAAQNGINSAEVSHFALAVLICWVRNSRALFEYPDLLQDPTLRSIVGESG
jgi:ppGpp synthetase/RelA/SpoT-type nucleotidyltranferase